MSDNMTITPSAIEMIAYNAGYRAGIAEKEAEIQTLQKQIKGLYTAIDEARKEAEKYKDAAEAWTVMVDEQALQIHNLQMDKVSLKKQIKGQYDAIDEARDEHARLSDELLDAKDIATKARGVMEKFADDLESSKYTVLIGQELRNRWKAAMEGPANVDDKR